MARPLRIQFENAYYHLTCRGNARQKIFFNDYDRKYFLDLLKRSSEIYQVQILAFVLMANHFHLIVKTPLANLQEFMRHFNISYTSYFNKRHKKTGHLYQGRYKSFVIDADSYLQEVSQYIHLNPVRMRGLSNLPIDEKKKYLRDYPWSSYPDYSAKKNRYPFLSRDDTLNYCGGDKKRYRDFVESGLSKTFNPLEKGKGHGIVGDNPFVENIKKHIIEPIKTKREMPAIKMILKQVEPEKIFQAVTKHVGVTKKEILKKGYQGIARPLTMDLLYRYAGMNQREIGEIMGVDYSSVSVGRKRLHIQLEKDAQLQRQIQGIIEYISQG